MIPIQLIRKAFRAASSYFRRGAALAARFAPAGCVRSTSRWSGLTRIRTAELLEHRQLLACDLPGGTCFAIVGDYGWDGPDEADVANLISGWDPDFVVTVGDNNYSSGSAATIDRNIGKHYQQYIAPYQGVHGEGSETNRFFPALGNADWEADNAQPYLDYFTLPGNERYYTFQWGPLAFFMLDSDPREPDGIDSNSVQAEWARQALAASTAKWKIVILHHPPYSSGGHGSHTDLQWPFQPWGATVVVAGHDHVYERLERDGIPYIVNGLGGRSRRDFVAPLAESLVRYQEDYGAMLVKANDDQITLQFTTRSGETIDSFRLSAPNPLVVTDVLINSREADPPDLLEKPQPASWSQQRSQIRSIVVRFNQDLAAAADDVVLMNLGVNAPQDPDQRIPLSASQMQSQGNQLILQFAPHELPDGLFQLTVLPTATGLLGQLLDGNGDGTAGDAFQLTGTIANRFYQLRSDWNADGGASIFDFPVFAYWFGHSVEQAPHYVDLNQDLGISIFDFPSFAQQFGVSLSEGPGWQWLAPPPRRAGLAGNETERAAKSISEAAVLDRRDALFAQLGRLPQPVPLARGSEYRSAGGPPPPLADALPERLGSSRK